MFWQKVSVDLKHRRGGEGSYSARESCAKICLEGFGEVSRLAVKEHIQNLLEYDSWVLQLTYNRQQCYILYMHIAHSLFGEPSRMLDLFQEGQRIPMSHQLSGTLLHTYCPKANQAISWIPDNLLNLTNQPFQCNVKECKSLRLRLLYQLIAG